MSETKHALPLFPIVATGLFVLGIGGWILNDVIQGRWPWLDPTGAKNVIIDVARLLPSQTADEKRSITIFRTVKASPDLHFVTGVKFQSSGDARSHAQYCYVERKDGAGTRRVLQLADVIGERAPKFVTPSADQATIYDHSAAALIGLAKSKCRFVPGGKVDGGKS
jgi:hypothetical protein